MNPELNWLADPTVFAVNRLPAQRGRGRKQRHIAAAVLGRLLALCMERQPRRPPGGFL